MTRDRGKKEICDIYLLARMLQNRSLFKTAESPKAS